MGMLRFNAEASLNKTGERYRAAISHVASTTGVMPARRLARCCSFCRMICESRGWNSYQCRECYAYCDTTC
jgi:hypothetical protein